MKVKVECNRCESEFSNKRKLDFFALKRLKKKTPNPRSGLRRRVEVLKKTRKNLPGRNGKERWHFAQNETHIRTRPLMMIMIMIIKSFAQRGRRR
mgnify:CR=1 FL=1